MNKEKPKWSQNTEKTPSSQYKQDANKVPWQWAKTKPSANKEKN